MAACLFLRTPLLLPVLLPPLSKKERKKNSSPKDKPPNPTPVLFPWGTSHIQSCRSSRLFPHQHMFNVPQALGGGTQQPEWKDQTRETDWGEKYSEERDQARRRGGRGERHTAKQSSLGAVVVVRAAEGECMWREGRVEERCWERKVKARCQIESDSKGRRKGGF